MKLIFILLIFSACRNYPVATLETKTDTIFIHDIVTVHDTVPCFIEHTPIPDVDKGRLIDSLKTRISILGFRIERVKYYLKICQHKPSQTKFLVSWISRAIANK